MKGRRLYKIEKLCSETAISRLFARSDRDVHTALTYPIRLAWRVDGVREVKVPRFLVSVPKKRLRHAVDRVTMRRRIREAFRLNHQRFILPEGCRVDLAFIYVGNKLMHYQATERAMCRILEALQQHYAPDSQES